MRPNFGSVKMSMRLAIVLLSTTQVSATAFAGWEDPGTPFDTAGASPSFHLNGWYRVRGDAAINLDLDRGPTPSGALLFPAPGADPENGQTLLSADMRLRLSPWVLYKGVAVKAQIDLLDNLTLGSTPLAGPADSVVTGQDIPRQGVNAVVDAVAVRRIWAEAALPIGMLAIGRMGSHWGLGMLANDGNGDEANGGDSADRLALVTPLLGHIWGLGFDWSASGPVMLRNGLVLDRDPSDDVRSVAASVLRYLPPEAVTRKVAAGKAVFNYGLFSALRWQDNDAVQTDMPGAAPSLWMDRGFWGSATDLWLRLNWQGLRVEAEMAYLYAQIANASLLPGVRLHAPAMSQQWGGTIITEWAPSHSFYRLAVQLGLASGDPAPGFGADNNLNPGAPGDLQGNQLNPPGDMEANNFRFHPDFYIDRILWRQLVGTFTDGVFAKLQGTLEPPKDLFAGALNGLSLELAMVGSAALYAESTPGLSNLLGVELDPTLRYHSQDGFDLLLAYGVLFPLAGLSNPALGINANPGQSLRVMTRFVF